MNKELINALKKQGRDWVNNNVVDGYNHEYHAAVDEMFIDAVLKDLVTGLEIAYGPDNSIPIQEIQAYISERYGVQ